MTQNLRTLRNVLVVVAVTGRLLLVNASPALGAGAVGQEACGDPLGAQVRLDRLGFSPGTIDGRFGAGSQRALKEFQAANELPTTGAVDCATWQALGADTLETTTKYTISSEDADGPFVRQIPPDLVKQAELESLGYKSLEEQLAERFHTTPLFLKRLNKGSAFSAGASIVVPNVVPFDVKAKLTRAADAPAAARVEVTRDGRLTVRSADGRTLLSAPVSSGSEHDPLPVGDWKVTGVSWMPAFHYNPDLFWDARPTQTKATIKPGPNNPVGVVWVDINVEHYGLHGSPEPANIGRTESHGCVRLTNWDAARLASLVTVGTPVTFK